ncbi:MAG: hypothetical protein ACFFDH_15745 [Promethearchaeota archaeon]
MIKKIWIGAICNRDMELFNQIIKFTKINYPNRISIVSLLKKDGKFSTKYFKKKIKKYPISFLILKLYSEPLNQIIYNAIKTYAPNIPILNSLRSVSTCESRNETFKFIEKNCKKLNIPKNYYTIKDAYDACRRGIPIIVKLDIHNAPHVSKYDRILGIAKNPEDLMRLIKNYAPKKLFFQQYLGKFDIVYKMYIIDKFTVNIRSHNRLREDKLTQLELIDIRVPINKQLKRRIKQIGRILGMVLYGVDYIITEDNNAYIVDINDFPSFKNIPEAISLISDYLYNRVYSLQVMSKVSLKIKG